MHAGESFSLSAFTQLESLGHSLTSGHGSLTVQEACDQCAPAGSIHLLYIFLWEGKARDNMLLSIKAT